LFLERSDALGVGLCCCLAEPSLVIGKDFDTAFGQEGEGGIVASYVLDETVYLLNP
jgi:hypothetical protein